MTRTFRGRRDRITHVVIGPQSEFIERYENFGDPQCTYVGVETMEDAHCLGAVEGPLEITVLPGATTHNIAETMEIFMYVFARAIRQHKQKELNSGD